MDQLAWEFTRRNGEYQKHWDIFNSLPDVSPGVGVKNGKNKGTPAFERPLSEYFGYVDPPALPDETYRDYMKRQGDNDYTVEPYLDFFIRVFGARPFNPRDDNPPDYLYDLLSEMPGVIELPREVGIPPDDVLKPNPSPVWAIDQKHLLRELADIRGSGEIKYPVCMVFDLSRPIDPQIEEAKSLLKDRRGLIAACNPEFKKKITRVPKKELASYLRLLDALAADATWPKIAAVLLPYEDNSHPDYGANDKLESRYATAKAYTYHLPR